MARVVPIRTVLISVLVLIAVLVPIPVGASGGRGVAWADAGTAAGLQVSVSGTGSAPELVLTNASGTPCQVADTSLGTTSFNQVTQQGHPIPATAFSVTFDDSVTHYLASKLRTLAPGGSLRVPLRAVPYGSTGSALETVTWSQTVAPHDRTTGNSSVRLVVDHDQSGTISIGGPPVTATIAQSGAAARFTFAANAGQKVSVQVTDSTFSMQCGTVILEDPGGKQLATGCVGNSSIPATTLPTSGRYTLVIQLTSRDTGRFSLQLTAAP